MRNIKFVHPGSDALSAAIAKHLLESQARQRLAQEALNSPAIRREIEAKVKRFVQDRLTETLRRASNGTFTIRL